MAEYGRLTRSSVGKEGRVVLIDKSVVDALAEMAERVGFAEIHLAETIIVDFDYWRVQT